ncbi:MULTISPECIES: phenylalanine--tRNA ligase subunit beta [Terrabacteria group]|uniref:phenylalanine--tRNA ligase subunit beta n=1 Tax=Bacillati TaxID=1783272 RepID=UPI001C6ED2F4|nr:MULTISPECIES: phenylalanine--tRNA ligase subunit beta [Terrabacteria group]MBW9212257.1 phenylalanine--tRNA ligase subunit beta [Trueperella sp. zg.1013]
MKLSYKWLSQYVDLKGISAQELAQSLTRSGHEVEGLETLASATGLVIGEIIESEPIPKTHLNKVQVRISDTDIKQIICGAPNCRTGLKVIVALPGAKLPMGEISAKPVHNLESNGMLCSLKELGVDTKLLRDKQINGIEELNQDAPVGETNVLAYLGLDDTILDISLTANRSDCLSMWAMAREVAAIVNRKVTLPTLQEHREVPSSFQIHLKTEKASYYLGKVIGRVKVGPSPKWLKEALISSGINSINNVVDISNYVMLETGQPLHFYQLSKLKNHSIEVVDGHQEKIRALDGVEFQLEPEDIVIETSGHFAGIAGVMGGEESMIDDETTSIFMEAAHFSTVQIRHTATRLNLMTEAASRFIKGMDPLAAQQAIQRATDLLVELAEGAEIEETVEAGQDGYTAIEIKETLSHLNQVLGTKFTLEQVSSILERLNFTPLVQGDEITCYIPSYRRDMELDADVQEEVIRLLGYDDLDTTLPRMEATVGERNERQIAKRKTRETLISFGLQEIVTYTLQSKEESEKALWPLGEAISLSMPMSEARSHLRTSLMTSVLASVQYNIAHKNYPLAFYEISKVYAKGLEQERLSIFLEGNYQEDKLFGLEEKSDFYTLKGILMAWLKKFGIQQDHIEIKENNEYISHFHPYRSALVYLNHQLLAIFGEVHPTLQKQYSLKEAFYAEVNLEVFYQVKRKRLHFKELDRYPSVDRDIALVVKKEIPAQKIVDTIRQNGKQLVRQVDIFDVYEGKHVAKEDKSIALRIRYQDSEHTLQESEVNEIHESILHELKEKCQAVLRS